MKRFKIVFIKEWGAYVIMDRKKLQTCIQDKRYTKRLFKTKEEAEGFLFATGKNPHIQEGDIVHA